jgi:hypothetical protein
MVMNTLVFPTIALPDDVIFYAKGEFPGLYVDPWVWKGFEKGEWSCKYTADGILDFKLIGWFHGENPEHMNFVKMTNMDSERVIFDPEHQVLGQLYCPYYVEMIVWGPPGSLPPVERIIPTTSPRLTIQPTEMHLTNGIRMTYGTVTIFIINLN